MGEGLMRRRGIGPDLAVGDQETSDGARSQDCDVSQLANGGRGTAWRPMAGGRR